MDKTLNSKLETLNKPETQNSKQYDLGARTLSFAKAEEALSRRDFVMRIKISRKEAKESGYWLSLSEAKDGQQVEERKKLVQEANELMKIFGAIVEKSK